MKCPICHGKGRVQDHKYNEEHDIEYLVYCEKKCEYCNGTGEVEQTEQEYIQTCNTEQLAEAILQQWIHGAYHGVGEFGLTDKEIESARDGIIEWLKEIHE